MSPVSRRARERVRRQSVVAPHNADPLAKVVSTHRDKGAKRIVMQKVRGSSPERWEVEATYDEWEEI